MLGKSDDEIFDDYDDFVPENIPEPGKFLDGYDVLEAEEHVEFHKKTYDIFEERGVYDMTFGYNLARLNLDRRHPDAGYRYGVDKESSNVLLAEFTPTTEFCPQSHTLTIGSFRAWNGLDDEHDYDLVKVRLDPMHHNSEEINEKLEGLEDHQIEDDGGTDMKRASKRQGCEDGSEGGRGKRKMSASIDEEEKEFF